jgi:hypothetical protein
MILRKHVIYFYLITKHDPPSKTPCFVDQEVTENAQTINQLCELLKHGGNQYVPNMAVLEGG